MWSCAVFWTSASYLSSTWSSQSRHGHSPLLRRTEAYRNSFKKNQEFLQKFLQKSHIYRMNRAGSEWNQTPTNHLKIVRSSTDFHTSLHKPCWTMTRVHLNHTKQVNVKTPSVHREVYFCKGCLNVNVHIVWVKCEQYAACVDSWID